MNSDHLFFNYSKLNPMFYLTFYNQLYFISRISILEQLSIPFWYQAVFDKKVGPYPHLFHGSSVFFIMRRGENFSRRMFWTNIMTLNPWHWVTIWVTIWVLYNRMITITWVETMKNILEPSSVHTNSWVEYLCNSSLVQ